MAWRLHKNGQTAGPHDVVAPDERLSWPRTIGIGVQHVLAMFGATVLVPALTGFPATATLFFSALGTFGFLLITRNKVPSYLGSSFAFLAPLGAAGVAPGASEDVMRAGLGGVLVTGLMLAAVGAAVHFAGTGWITAVMPPVVTGAIVMLIGLNLAVAAKDMFQADRFTASITLATTLLAMVAFAGFLGRMAILVGAIGGGVFATLLDKWDFTGVNEAAWWGTPDFMTPTFDGKILLPFVPVVVVLIAENIGHLKSVSALTGTDLDPMTGRALFADGLATTLAGAGGGSGTTTYAENIGVMAATRVYSTLAYWVAGATALLLSFSPKFGALVSAIPIGVLGGLAILLFGMIAVLGARIWVQNRVDFSHPANLAATAIALIIGAANFEWQVGDLGFGGIALGTIAVLVAYHAMKWISVAQGTHGSPLVPAPFIAEAAADKPTAHRK